MVKMVRQKFLLVLFMLTMVACQRQVQDQKLEDVDRAFIIEGGSMEPGFPIGTILAIDEDMTDKNALQRGDIVVHELRDPGILGLKRIIGLPNEEVEIKDGVVYIDGRMLVEPYAHDSITTNNRSWHLGANEYFLLGDNRLKSADSRHWGPLSADKIVGRAVFKCTSRILSSCREEIESVNYDP